MAYRNMQGEVKNFLEQNDVKLGWQKLILDSKSLTQKLGKIITDELPSPYTYAPKYDKILNAFSHAEPGDIKVVIIGTSPAATDHIATGLAFSSDQKESYFREGQAIYKVHRALREAKILKKGDFRCDHEEWAGKGVLLLNAALTITEVERESSDNIKSHYKIWKEFLQELLLEWLIKTSISHKLFVMRWGYAPSDNMTNYAEDVWNNVHEHQDVLVEKNIHLFPVIHHPTFPSPQFELQNNFLIEAPGHFKIIKEEYKTIFSLKPVDSVDDIAEQTKKLSLKESHRVR